MSKPSDYKKLPQHKGIYKHKTNGKFHARKKINGKYFCATFDTINEARKWRYTFNGEKEVAPIFKTSPTLLEVWEKMQELHFPSLAISTREIWKIRFGNIVALYPIHMEDLKPQIINKWMEEQIEYYLSDEYDMIRSSACQKHNLDNELSLIVTMCNWYRNEYQLHDFFPPILPRHRKMSKFRDLPVKDKKISPEEAFKIFSALPELYRDLLTMQYLIAGRIGETAGIQIKNIDLEARILTIKESCIWANANKTFVALSPFPKNKQIRQCYITDMMMEIIKRRLKQKKKGCDFLYHVDGSPLNYCTIQSNIKSAQRKVKSKFTGTHIFRHGMATLTRRLTGSLDAVQAITGHQDRDLADHYSEVGESLQKDTANQIEEYLRTNIIKEKAINNQKKEKKLE